MMLSTPRTREEMLDQLKLENKVCAEIGICEGYFSGEILKRNPKRLFMVDPWVHQDQTIYSNDHSNRSQAEFNRIYHGLIEKYSGDGRVQIIRDYSLFASKNFENESLDFVYIDAVHTFESTFCDIVAWFHKVKDDGWLCGHDFTGDFTGVKLAVEAFCRISNQSLSLMTLEPWGSWGIRKVPRAAIKST